MIKQARYRAGVPGLYVKVLLTILKTEDIRQTYIPAHRREYRVRPD